ncbi:hypothetical protein BT96DRAFT_1003017 [Gymnopus androsaceus JB14]|uniref:Zn(2)-C6 fungal-type domain-containing protein n=1 Tax=Gymnopus androsaceus JB14 TaxID=1447944 RepID=A0A6A4GXA9_9AGAR|nr:hypothetical protein BT96DRAFT_1003017 [Gymnopus androsaceus JB14]
MSTSARKARAPSEPQPPTRGNDCKRRRNRPILSCLSCHTSKRMCDRKRPTCARCTEMGLTGHCVYEVDESSQHLNTQDRCSRLRNRVAELEGEIEELKNKQQHCSEWVSEHSDPGQHETADFLNQNPSSSSTSPSLRDLSPSSTGLDFSTALAQDSRFVGYKDIMEMQHHFDSISPESSHHCNPMQQCICVQDTSNYQTMLELSVRLRKAVTILAQHPHHQAGRYCLLNQTLVELDTLTADSLSPDSPHHRVPSYSPTPPLSAPHAINATLTRLDLDTLFSSAPGGR